MVRVDLDVLPKEAVYRPIARQAWFSRSLPLAVGLGLAIGLLSTWLTPVVIWLALFGLVGVSVSRRRRMYRFLRQNDDGVAMLAAGEIEAAADIFDELCSKARRMPALHSLFVYNRAVSLLERGDADRAVALLTAVVHAGWIGPRGAMAVYYPSLLGRLALAEALRGRLDQAGTWRSRAHAAVSTAKRGGLLLVDVVLEARAGRFDEVIGLIEQGWTRAENLLTAKQLRAVRLVEAFSLERGASADYRAESRDADLRRALEQARSGRRSDFDYLLVNWPELRQFARHHGL